jgi:hypothetical protein
VPDQTPATEPIVQATRYTVNCLPEDSSPDANVFDLVVEYRGKDTWAVTRHHRSLGRDGTWSYGPEWPADAPGSREPATDAEHEGYESARQEWLGEHRFDLDEAIELAKAAAPLVNVNGLTPETALARIARIRTAGGPS